MTLIENLESMLDKGEDNALLRFSLGKAYLDRKQYKKAIGHLNKSLEFEPGYSAAWKTLARAQIADQQNAEARDTLTKGIRAAEEKGDMQALREMKVFLKRLEKTGP